MLRQVGVLSGRIVEQVQSFAPFLRQYGFRVGTPESLTAIAALSAIEIESMEQVMDAMRSIYAKSPAEWGIFPSLFKRHFGILQHELKQKTVMEAEGGLQGSGNFTADTSSSLQIEGAMLRAYNPDHGQRYALQVMKEGQLRQILHWTKKAVLQFDSPRSRRLQKGRRFSIDFRRTLRTAMKNGGDPFVIYKRKYRKARPRIVVVTDVSGSMKPHADFFTTIAWAFLHTKARVEAFVFSTDIKRVTPLLSRKIVQGIPYEQLIELKGGTRIGSCLTRLLNRYGSLLRQKTWLIIVSDGYDTGNPQILKRAMESLSGQVGKIVWVNPLLGEEGYEPVAAGMSTALPYVDRFVDVHDLESWMEAVKRNLFANGGSADDAPSWIPGMQSQSL
nr:VWA domain-containing protein [Brevibacillus sp. SYP-B805]